MWLGGQRKQCPDRSLAEILSRAATPKIVRPEKFEIEGL